MEVSTEVICITIGIIMLVGICGSTSVAHMDFVPASGEMQGFVFYQEVYGFWQQDRICWKDTPWQENCEWFDPAGVKYTPGKYTMSYVCERHVWAWEAGSGCHIINGTKIGEIEMWGSPPKSSN